MARKPFIMMIGVYDGKRLFFSGIKDSNYVYSTTDPRKAYVFHSPEEIDEVFEGDYERRDYTTGDVLTTVKYFELK